MAIRIPRNSLYLYSTNTKLANLLSKEYYRGIHYVWCSPVFDPSELSPLDPLYKIPPSSSPLDIYKTLKNDVYKKDHHSSKIDANKVGLKKGATFALQKGIIDNFELATITELIDLADFELFNPILYIIPISLVQNKLEEVPTVERANPFGKEYRIPNLKDGEFEVIHQF
jgi:hypothetical protein